MATNKHAQIRYIALDKCFSNFGRKYYIEDLVKACNEAIYDFTGKQEGVKKRQVYEDIKFMESLAGYHIDLERFKDGRKIFFKYRERDYSINKSPLNEVEVNQINEVLLTLSRFKGMPQFEWVDEISSRLQSLSRQDDVKIIDFEQNQFLKGLEYITPLFNAIFFKRVLEVKYLSFKGENEITNIIHPYFLKQYNLRWFLFGLNEKESKISNQALDRIISIKELDYEYKPNTEIDFNEYFDDVIGVTILPKPLELVTLLVTNDLWPYIKTKPIHGSQKQPQFTPDGVIIELELIINYEFISVLLSYGERLKILSPVSLINDIKGKLKIMVERYN